MTTVGFNTQENGMDNSLGIAFRNSSLLGAGKLIVGSDLASNPNRARLGPTLPPPRPPARTCSFSSVTSPTPPPPPPAAAHQSILARFLSSPRPKVSAEQQQQAQPPIAEDPHEATVPAILPQQPLRDRPRNANPEARLSTFSKKQTPLPLTATLPNSLSTTTFVTLNQPSASNGIEPLQNVVCDSIQRPIPPIKPNRDGSIKLKGNKKSAK